MFFLKIITELVLESKYQTLLILNVNDTPMDLDVTETLLIRFLLFPSKTFFSPIKLY